MKITRAKMTCTKTVDESGMAHINLIPVYSDHPDSENKAFSDATPSGRLYLAIAPGKPAADNFENGKTYYVDIHEATQPDQAALQLRVVPALPDAGQAKTQVADMVSVAVGSQAEVKCIVTTAAPGDEVGKQAKATMSGTRNAEGGIDYVLEVDPIEIGHAPGSVGS